MDSLRCDQGYQKLLRSIGPLNPIFSDGIVEPREAGKLYRHMLESHLGVLRLEHAGC
jgi:hypothetical protein